MIHRHGIDRSGSGLPAGQLLLGDGRHFNGASVGHCGFSLGEVVFHTGMSGYQEIITDPSYAGQIVAFTYPHIGNTGINSEDEESSTPRLAGIVLRDMTTHPSSWRSRGTLQQYFRRHKICAISGIDTRSLTHHIRRHGAQKAILYREGTLNLKQALLKLQAFPGLASQDLAKTVTTSKQYCWKNTTWESVKGHAPGGKTSYSSRQANIADARKPVVVVYDFGVKRNILSHLVASGAEVQVVPSTTPAEDVLTMKPSGVLLSNGPGDPHPGGVQRNIGILAKAGLPMLGICFGHQLLCLHFGAQSIKMEYGHHGANHPVLCLHDRSVVISSQNHSYCVSDKNFPDVLEVTHRSLFDKTIQGFRHKYLPIFGFQGHPEGSPGPQDISSAFCDFMSLLKTDHVS